MYSTPIHHCKMDGENDCGPACIRMLLGSLHPDQPPPPTNEIWASLGYHQGPPAETTRVVAPPDAVQKALAQLVPDHPYDVVHAPSPDALLQTLITQCAYGPAMVLVHGDGHWCVVYDFLLWSTDQPGQPSVMGIMDPLKFKVHSGDIYRDAEYFDGWMKVKDFFDLLLRKTNLFPPLGTYVAVVPRGSAAAASAPMRRPVSKPQEAGDLVRHLLWQWTEGGHSVEWQQVALRDFDGNLSPHPGHFVLWRPAQRPGLAVLVRLGQDADLNLDIRNATIYHVTPAQLAVLTPQAARERLITQLGAVPAEFHRIVWDARAASSIDTLGISFEFRTPGGAGPSWSVDTAGHVEPLPAARVTAA